MLALGYHGEFSLAFFCCLPSALELTHLSYRLLVFITTGVNSDACSGRALRLIVIDCFSVQTLGAIPVIAPSPLR